MTDRKTDHEIGLVRQIILHLFPGGALTLAYIGLATQFYKAGLPSILGFYAASVVILFPLEIGLPIFLERKKKSQTRLTEVFLFRERQPTWQVAMLVGGSLLWAGLVFVIAGGALVEPIKESLFSWTPEWFDLGHFLLSQSYSRPVRIVTWALGILFGAIAAPIIEELYFRGYLLPRMSTLKGWAPLVGAVLFALYHFWSPWLFAIRLIAILPMVYAVWWKKNIWIGIFAHCLLNLVGDSLLVIPLVFQ